MPDIPGLEVLKNIRDINPEAKIIVATADLQEITKNIVLENGAIAIINKPFDENEIQNLLNSLEATT